MQSLGQTLSCSWPSKSPHTVLVCSFCHLQSKHCILLRVNSPDWVTFKECFLSVADMKKRGSRPEKKGKINFWRGWRVGSFSWDVVAFCHHYLCYNQSILCSFYPDSPHSLHLFSTDLLKISKSCRREEKLD